MSPRLPVLAIVLVAALVLVPAPARAQGEKPKPALDLPVPKAPSKEFDGKDLTGYPAPALSQGAAQAIQNDDAEVAVQLQHWAVAADPSSGQYNLACYYALAGDVDASLYWLQRAALEEGVDLEWAKEDSDLEDVRKDARWAKLSPFIGKANAYWASSGHRREVVTVPKGYTPGTPIPVLLGLHGMGSKPEDFAGGEGDQALADALGIALVSVSATSPRGPNSFVWSEDIDADAKHIAAALERVAAKVTPRKGAVIPIGFSQGAQLAIEIAARDPELYGGAIALCPGFQSGSHLEKVTAAATLGKRAFVIISGAEEHPGNLELAATDAAWLEKAEALVVKHVYDEMGHQFPPGFYDNAAIWCQFILGLGERAK